MQYIRTGKDAKVKEKYKVKTQYWCKNIFEKKHRNIKQIEKYKINTEIYRKQKNTQKIQNYTENAGVLRKCRNIQKCSVTKNTENTH